MNRLILAAGMLCFAVCTLPLTAAEGVPDQPVPLWPSTPPGDEGLELPAEADTSGEDSRQVAGRRVIRLGNVSQPTMTVYAPDPEKSTGAAVVICPGGGHHILAYDLEGTEVAEWLQGLGVTAVVLKYRVPAREGRPRWEAAVQDAQRAVRLVRGHAEDWGIDPQRVGILGFSAGGQTAALTALRSESTYEPVDDIDDLSSRPDFAVLVYPAYLVQRENPTTLVDEATVTDEAPPMFLVHAWDDPVTPQSSLQLAAALKQLDVPVEVHLYSTGGHGYGMRPTDLPVTRWPAACEAWMRTSGLLER